MENPLVSNADVERYREYGAKKMINALSLLTRYIPGRFPSTYLYIAEKGIVLHLKGLERIAALHEDLIKSLKQLIKQ